MIFNEIHDGMGHMIEWLTPNGTLIFLGVVSFMIIVIILLFVLNRSPNHEVHLDDTTDTITPSGKNKENSLTETSKFCPECGSKLDDRNSKFCALCGTKL